ncbi:hypothetical protein [Actinoplanes teichomyceticus]|uniref:hypothetical protein n=1 Tax=Actinoplanes teichomyceticus TaxID=1867 RepID=UPI0011EAC5A0|nr:hypothetical protein [Actinoplanes teichomyceticus]GIF13128.1 hypothetical protein Ate01nite_31600 [Actinoplanes teichomyceticus]
MSDFGITGYRPDGFRGPIQSSPLTVVALPGPSAAPRITSGRSGPSRPSGSKGSGQVPRLAEILEYAGATVADGSIALGFASRRGHLTICNALDENGLFSDPPSRDWREHVP